MTDQTRDPSIVTSPQLQVAWNEYLQAVDRGETVDAEELLARHADIADELRSMIEFDRKARLLANANGPNAPSSVPVAATVVPARSKAEVSTHSVVGSIEQTAGSKPKQAASSVAPATNNSELTGLFGGRYSIKKKLGSGAMGAVYLAEDTLLQRDVAIKTPTFENDEDGELLKRFYREARAVAKLKHPNLCGVYDVGEIDGRHYISMEFVPGRKLTDYIKPNKPMTEKQAMAVIRKIALAMHEAHSRGVIHRDLKPDNIMINEKGEPVVMDFGLVHKAESKDSTKITQHGTLIGSPAYMSKEQVEGDPDKLTGATDQYSLGVILYQLLTSKLPFEGGIHAVLGAILTRDPPSPSTHRPDLNPHLEAVCLKMMAKDAKDRYPSTKAAADALAEVARSTSTVLGASILERPPAGSPSKGNLETSLEIGPAFGSFTEFMSDSNSRLSERRKATSRGQIFLPPRGVLAGALATGSFLILAVMLWFRGDALFRIEVHSDDVEVRFNNETITLTEVAHEYRVSPGDHRLHIKSGDVEFDTEKVTLKKGNNPAVTVELLNGDVVVKQGQKTIGRERTRKIDNTDDQNVIVSSLPSNRVATSLPANGKSDTTPQAASNIKQPSSPIIARLKLFAQLPSDFIFTTAVSGDGKLVVGGNAGLTRIWNAADGSTAADLKLETKTTPRTLAFTPDSRYLAWGGWGNEEIRLYETTTGEFVRKMQGNSSMVLSLCFSADGRRLLSGSQGRRFGNGYQFSHGPNSRVWNVETGEELRKFVGEGVSVGGSWLADGRRAVSRNGNSTMGDEGSLVRLWDTETGKEELVYGRDLTGVRNVTLSPHSKYVAATLKNGVVIVWETESGQQLQRFEPAGHATFTTDGERLLCSSKDGASLRMWDVRTGVEWLRVEDKLPDGIGMIHMFSQGDRALVSTYQSGHAYIVPLSSPESQISTPSKSASSNQPTDSRKNDYDGIATGRWVRIVDASTPLSNPERMRFSNGLLELNDVALNLPNVLARDIIVRAKVMKVSGQVVGIRLRDNGKGRIYGFWFNGGNWFGIGKTGRLPWKDLIDGRVGPPQPDFFEMAASVVGDSLSLYVNGTQVHCVRDSELIDGSVTLVTGGGKSLFKEVEVMVLDTVPMASATSVNTAKKQTELVRAANAPSPAIAPFTADKAKKHQEDWASYLKVPVEHENSVGIKTVLIPPGEFIMGRLPGEAARFPRNGLYQEPATTQHKVTLTRPFRMGTTEVTRRQWRDVMGSEPWRGKDKGPEGNDYPANYTTKTAAKEFCKRLSEKEGKTYRLPTEAEWEFACRAGSVTLYFFGENHAQVGEYACKGGLQTVAAKKPNPWGLFDMYGNLWEWVADGRTAFTSDAAVDPLLNPSDAQSIIRGSCFRSVIPAEFSSGARHSWPGTLPTDEKGFRIVCEADR